MFPPALKPRAGRADIGATAAHRVRMRACPGETPP
jgi:hypothetical protein